MPLMADKYGRRLIVYRKDELPVRERPWVRELLARESFTGKEAGELAGKYGADAITQLRNARGLRLVRVGKLEGGHHRAGRFRLVETAPPKPTYPLTDTERTELTRAIAESDITDDLLTNKDIDDLVDLFAGWLECREVAKA